MIYVLEKLETSLKPEAYDWSVCILMSKATNELMGIGDWFSVYDLSPKKIGDQSQN